MGDFKEKFKGAYNDPAVRNVKTAKDVPYYKLAKMAMYAGIASAILMFGLMFYGCELAVGWSILIAFITFIVVQPVVGICAALKLNKSK